jgi:hypothetical protein
VHRPPSKANFAARVQAFCLYLSSLHREHATLAPQKALVPHKRELVLQEALVTQERALVLQEAFVTHEKALVPQMAHHTPNQDGTTLVCTAARHSQALDICLALPRYDYTLSLLLIYFLRLVSSTSAVSPKSQGWHRIPIPCFIPCLQSYHPNSPLSPSVSVSDYLSDSI